MLNCNIVAIISFLLYSYIVLQRITDMNEDCVNIWWKGGHKKKVVQFIPLPGPGFFFPSPQFPATAAHQSAWPTMVCDRTRQDRRGRQTVVDTRLTSFSTRHGTHMGVCHPAGLPRATRHILLTHKYPEKKTSWPSPNHDPGTEIKSRHGGD